LPHISKVDTQFLKIHSEAYNKGQRIDLYVLSPNDEASKNSFVLKNANHCKNLLEKDRRTANSQLVRSIALFPSF